MKGVSSFHLGVILMGSRSLPPLPDEADGDGDGATPDTPPAGDAEAAQPPPPGSAERPINSLRIVRIQDQALRAFRQSRGDIRQAGRPQCFRIFATADSRSESFAQMRVARRRLDLRVSGQVLFGAEPWPVGLWQCKTLGIYVLNLTISFQTPTLKSREELRCRRKFLESLIAKGSA